MRKLKCYLIPFLFILIPSVGISQQTKKLPDEQPGKLVPRPKSLRPLQKHANASKEIMEIARQVAPSMSDSTVTLVSGRRKLALGTIVSPDGLILTKAGKLQSKADVLLAGKRYDFQIIGIHHPTDLAMIKIDASDLPSIKPVETSPLKHGRWLISIGPDEEPVAMGVFAREPTRVRAVMGVMLAERSGVQISNVLIGSPASRADLYVNDTIKSFDGTEVTSVAQLHALIDLRKPYDRVQLTIVRSNKEQKVFVQLEERFVPSKERRNRSYFENAFEHDSKFRPSQCGGPVVNLSGEIVGINVASPSRLQPPRDGSSTMSNSTLASAIPIDHVIPIMEALRSGELSPEKLNKPQIEQLVPKIKKLHASLGELTEQMENMRAEFQQLEEAVNRFEELKQTYESVRRNASRLEADIRKSESKLDRLRNGTR